MDGLGVNITIMSYRGVLYWGIMACPEAIPKVWNLAADIPLALDELLEAAALEPATYRSADAADAARAAGIDVPAVAHGPTEADTPPTTIPPRKTAARKMPAKKTAARKTSVQTVAASAHSTPSRARSPEKEARPGSPDLEPGTPVEPAAPRGPDSP
jgi:hypothetical protein